jgi:hypothetical protein
MPPFCFWRGDRGRFAIPFVLADGHPFPGNYILFITFCVILTTLVV